MMIVKGQAAKDEDDLSRMRPIKCRARPRGLESPWHVGVTVRIALCRQLAAEVEITIQGITKWPAAVMGQERRDRLSLIPRDVRDVCLNGCGGALDFTHSPL
jgi:hypothetical protein